MPGVTPVPPPATGPVGPPPQDAAEPRYTVAAVARRLGVAPATLRTWDRRYGLGPSGHSTGAHRRYSAADVSRLEVVRRLTHEGVAPADAARIVLAGEQDDAGGRGAEAATGGASPAADPPAPPARPEAPRTAGVPVDDGGAAAYDPVSAAAAGLSATTPAGGGRVLALPGSAAEVRGFARAAMALDAETVTDVLARAVQERGLVRAWEELVRPVLVAIGERWAVTGEGVEVEHLVSECTATALRTTVSKAPPPRPGRPVLLACTPGEGHSLPLQALAAGLAQQRVGARLLGAALPDDALAAAVRRTGPAAVFLWAQFPATADPALLQGLPQTRPAATVVVGGPGWAGVTLPERVEHARGLQHALDLLSAAAG